MRELDTTDRERAARFRVRARLLPEPCLWCWEIVDHVSGDEIEDSWSSEWCGYRTQQEALVAGRRRLRAIESRASAEGRV